MPVTKVKQEVMKVQFKQMVESWAKNIDSVYKMEELLNNLYSTENIDRFESVRLEFENTYIKAMCKLFEVLEGNEDILNEDWFWAEWTATDECFYFVFGLTASARDLTDFLGDID